MDYQTGHCYIDYSTDQIYLVKVEVLFRYVWKHG